MNKKINKLLIVPFLCLLSGCIDNSILKLKESTFNFELGEEIPIDISYYLERTTKDISLKSVFMLDDENPKKELPYHINYENKNVISNDKGFLEVGDYDFYIKYADLETEKIHVSVSDTKSPIILSENEEIILEQDDKNIDFKKYFNCHDLSVCKISIDDTNVNINKIGNYEIIVNAIDKYDNKSSKTFKVKVISPNSIKNSNDDNDEIKKFNINSNNIIDIFDIYSDADGFTKPIILEFRQNIILNNKNELTYYGSYTDTIYALNKITNLNVDELNKYYNDRDENFKLLGEDEEIKKYIIIKPEYLEELKDIIMTNENELITSRILYTSTIINALKTMNLKCTEKEMINQISEWIIKNIDFKHTNNEYFKVFNNREQYIGNSSHYSIVFRDMCKALRIECEYVEGTIDGTPHMWNKVKLNNIWYYTDITLYKKYNMDKYLFSETLWDIHKIK